MNEAKQIPFHVYRYQILPIRRDTLQLQIDSPIKTLDELIEHKNEIFQEAVLGLREFTYSRARLVHRVVASDADLLLLQFGASKSLRRKNRNFELEQIENWPSVYLAINNRPDVQKLAIQLNRAAFSSTATFARVIEDDLNDVLGRYNLRVYIEPLFDEGSFWDLVDRYPNQITQVEFELISPNMSNISGGLKLDLGALHRSTNTKKTELQLNSDESANLTLSRDDETIGSLVTYASEGGGAVHLRVKGIRRKVNVGQNATEVSVDELDIQVERPQDAVKVLRSMLK